MAASKILVAEDEPHILRVMSMWLTRQGYEVLEARNGAEALALLRQHAVEILISDMNMPGMDGLALIRAVRKEFDPVLPVLCLTARCDQNRLSEQLRPFHVRLYPKPFVPSRLVAEIDEVLKAAAQG